jgi:hypothetical protein
MRVAQSIFWSALALACVGCGYKAVTVPSGTAGSAPNPGAGTAGTTDTTGGGGVVGSAGVTASAGASGSAGVAGSAGASGSAGTTGSAGSTAGAGGDAGAAGTGAAAGAGGAPPMKATNPNLTYTKITVHTRFLAESVAIGDYNHDGVLDVAAGRRWYAGPFTPGYNVAAWAAYGYDVNADGWDDIIQIAASDMGPMLAGQTPIPFGSGNWYQNPKNVGTGNWPKFQISADMKGEHKVFTDMTGDGKPEILGSCKSCKPIQTWGYWQADWANPSAPWTFHPVTRTYDYKDGCCGWLHGLGAGDVNGDGKPDLMERSGVWLQPPTPTGAWTFINVAFSIPEFLGTQPDIGGSHMYAYDVDGDGLTDIVSSLNSHGYGLAWFKQAPAGTFTRQMIMNTPAEMAMYGGVAVSQLHSLCLEDMDGDGLKDIVTGKTFLAHPYATGDAGNMDPVQLYVFKLVRTPTAHFEPHLIDADSATQKGSGVARQFTVVDMNKDGINDFVIASKRGLFVYLGKP